MPKCFYNANEDPPMFADPALVTVLRGINAFHRISALIPQRLVPGGEKAPQLDRIMSPSPELAYRQTTLFFRDKELFADNSARPLLQYLPPVRVKGEERWDKIVKSIMERSKSEKSAYENWWEM